MTIKKQCAGEYTITVKDGRKFGLLKDGGTSYPWNIRYWDKNKDMPDYCAAPYGCYETKQEAVAQLSYEDI